MSVPIITLTTDFGLRDSYVAEMKAVILGIVRDATIIDITHDVEKFNVRMGAYILASASRYFPNGTIHVAVVDPTVGTERRALLVQTDRDFLIGPDNGILTWALGKRRIEHVYEITNAQYILQKSATFHGRDVFAPAAAHLALGAPPREFGPEVQKIVTPKFAHAIRKKDGLAGEVIHIDSFGNIITNFDREDLKKTETDSTVSVELKRVKLKLMLCEFYAKPSRKELLAVIGSHGFLEIGINQGNAAKCLKAKIGDRVMLYRSLSSRAIC